MSEVSAEFTELIKSINQSIPVKEHWWHYALLVLPYLLVMILGYFAWKYANRLRGKIKGEHAEAQNDEQRKICSDKLSYVAGITKLTLAILGFWIVLGLIYLVLPEQAAPVGDSFGTFNALFSGLALVGVIVAIFMQGQELKQTQLELAGQKKELEIQNKTALRSRFETTYFSMLRTHFEMAQNIGMNAFESAYATFELAMPDIYNLSNPNIMCVMLKNRANLLLGYTEKFFYQGIFSSYFQYFQHIVRYVDSYDIKSFLNKNDVESINERKKEYFESLKSQLSKYELLILFYYLFFINSEELFIFCEKNNFFSNIVLNDLKDPFDLYLLNHNCFNINNATYFVYQYHSSPDDRKKFFVNIQNTSNISLCKNSREKLPPLLYFFELWKTGFIKYRYTDWTMYTYVAWNNKE